MIGILLFLAEIDLLVETCSVLVTKVCFSSSVLDESQKLFHASWDCLFPFQIKSSTMVFAEVMWLH